MHIGLYAQTLSEMVSNVAFGMHLMLQEALKAKNSELSQLHMELQDLHASNDAVSVTAVAVNKVRTAPTLPVS